MKMVESSDGTVKIVELDPTKHHILIVDDNALIGPVRLRDGAIIYKRQGQEFTIVEGSDGIREVRKDA